MTVAAQAQAQAQALAIANLEARYCRAADTAMDDVDAARAMSAVLGRYSDAFRLARTAGASRVSRSSDPPET
jgi:hypothetical protein